MGMQNLAFMVLHKLCLRYPLNTPAGLLILSAQRGKTGTEEAGDVQGQPVSQDEVGIGIQSASLLTNPLQHAV